MPHPLTTEAEQAQNRTTTAGVSGATTLDLGRVSKDVDVWVDVSGDAHAVLEVSHNGTFGGEEHEADNVTYTGASTDFRQYEIAYQHIRAYTNSSLNELELVSRGLD